MFTYCTFCFTPIGERLTKYNCILEGKKINMEIGTCPECDFFYDFHPKIVEGDSREDILNELGQLINENKIKETFCYLCSNHRAKYVNLKWNNEEIQLRMCDNCIINLPSPEDKFVAEGNSYEEALVFVKRSLLF
jgi:hypothetical protein